MKKTLKADMSSMIILGREGIDDYAYIWRDGTKKPWLTEEEYRKVIEELTKKGVYKEVSNQKS